MSQAPASSASNADYAAQLGLTVARGHPNVLFEGRGEALRPHRSASRLVVPLTTKSGEHFKGGACEDGLGNCCGQGGGGCCAFGGGGFGGGDALVSTCDAELREELLARGGQKAVASWEAARERLVQGLAGRCCAIGNCLLCFSLVGLPVLCVLEASRQRMYAAWLAHTNDTLLQPLGMYGRFQTVSYQVDDGLSLDGGRHSHSTDYSWMAVSLTAQDARSLQMEPTFWAQDFGIPVLYCCTCKCDNGMGEHCCAPCRCCCFQKSCI